MHAEESPKVGLRLERYFQASTGNGCYSCGITKVLWGERLEGGEQRAPDQKPWRALAGWTKEDALAKET